MSLLLQHQQRTTAMAQVLLYVAIFQPNQLAYDQRAATDIIHELSFMHICQQPQTATQPTALNCYLLKPP